MLIPIQIARNIIAYLIEKDNMKFSYSKQLIEILNKNNGNNNDIEIPSFIIESLCKYCEVQAIWDKLGCYGNFYYRLKQILRQITNN